MLETRLNACMSHVSELMKALIAVKFLLFKAVGYDEMLEMQTVLSMTEFMECGISYVMART